MKFTVTPFDKDGHPSFISAAHRLDVTIDLGDPNLAAELAQLAANVARIESEEEEQPTETTVEEGQPEV